MAWGTLHRFIEKGLILVAELREQMEIVYQLSKNINKKEVVKMLAQPLFYA